MNEQRDKDWVFWENRILLWSYLDVNFEAPEDKLFCMKLFDEEPKFARSILEDFKLTDFETLRLIMDRIVYNEFNVIGVLGFQRVGKDALVTFLLDLLTKLYPGKYRIVTLGNFKRPPFVKEGDMYYSLASCPVGSVEHPVIIYTSELDLFFPARDMKGKENQALNSQINTLGQNHQSLIGCAKLAYNVDLSFWRATTMKFFKYIPTDSLKHERFEFLSELGLFLRPKDPLDKQSVMAVFNDSVYTFKHELPSWWTQKYSEQFHNISESKLLEYAQTLLDSGHSYNDIRMKFSQQFRFNKPISFYKKSLIVS